MTKLGCNYKNEVIRVQLKMMPLNTKSSGYSRKCPVCKEGTLLMRRNTETFKLSAYDGCLLCGQQFFYTDLAEVYPGE